MAEFEELQVNDGKGLMDSQGLIDSLIEDCNELPRDLMSGHNIRFCSRLVGMVQKLASLKKGVADDTNALKKQVADLKRLIDEMTAEEFEKGDEEADELDR